MTRRLLGLLALILVLARPALAYEPCASGSIAIGQGTGAQAQCKAISGDASVTSGGAWTNGKVNGNTPGNTCSAHQYVNVIDTSARGTCAQPVQGDLSDLPLTATNGGTGNNNASPASGRYLKGNGTGFATSSGSASGTGSCTNQAVTATNSDAAPSCSTITSSYVDTSIGKTASGIDQFAAAGGNYAMGSHKVTGLVAGTASGDSLAFGLNHLNDLTTATGNYAMGSNKLTGLAAGAANGDSMRFEQTHQKLNMQTGNPLASFASSIAENTLWTYTLPANTLGTDGHLHCQWYGDLTNNTGGAVTYVFRSYWGGVHTTWTSASVSSNASPYPWFVDQDIYATGATNTNAYYAHEQIMNTAGAAGASAGFTNNVGSGYSAAAQDTTSTQIIKLTIAMGTSSSSAITEIYAGGCWLTPP
jgi:hypothetical protein